MRAVFINLDEAAERRAAIEASFAATAPAGSTLERLPAVTAAEAARHPGSRPATEKGCFLSHLAALRGSVDDPAPLLVLEDDALLSVPAHTVLPEALGMGWDLAFGDIAPGNVGVTVELARQFDRLDGANDFALMDLAARQFSGSTAYAVSARGRRAILTAAQAIAGLDQPYDVFLRSMIQAGSLRAAVCVPFVTSISPAAARSQIQGENFGLQCLNAARRLLFVDRDLRSCSEETAPLVEGVSETGRLLGRVFAGMVSQRMPTF